jgi:TldD protein
MSGGNLVTNRTSITAGVSARCYDKGIYGFASSSNEDDSSLKLLLSEARAHAKLISSCHGGSKSSRSIPITSAVESFHYYRTKKQKLNYATRIDLLKCIDDHVKSRYPDVINTDLVLTETVIETGLATSEGILSLCFNPSTALLVQLSVQSTDGPVQLYNRIGGFGEFEDQWDTLVAFDPFIASLYVDLCSKAVGVFCEAGTYDVILDSEVTGLLAHEAIGHTCEADHVLLGSISDRWVNRQVASDKITLVDQMGRGFNNEAGIAIYVDDEGTQCDDVTIIQNGILKGFLHDKLTALKMNVKPTGNARAFTFSDEPQVRMRNTAIMPGQDRFEDMIGSVDQGYYLKRAINGQADLNSEFMFGIVCGYEISNGKIGRAIRDTTISGSAFHTLRAVTHVGDQFSWLVDGWCGKKTWIPVGMGGPAIKTRLGIGGH